jgi:DNA-binding response OmpR family regulator
MLTALSQDSDRERAESLGVDDYLVKSQVVIADVVEKIKSHLGM